MGHKSKVCCSCKYDFLELGDFLRSNSTFHGSFLLSQGASWLLTFASALLCSLISLLTTRQGFPFHRKRWKDRARIYMIYIYTYIFIFLYTLCIYIYLNTYKYIYTHIFIHLYIYIRTYMCILGIWIKIYPNIFGTIFFGRWTSRSRPTTLRPFLFHQLPQAAWRFAAVDHMGRRESRFKGNERKGPWLVTLW